MNKYNEVCEKYKIKSISSLTGDNQTVFLRVDFNVPVDHNSLIVDDSRIKSTVETIEFLLKKNSCITIVSHFGDPKNKADRQILSFNRLIDQISKILNCEIYFSASESLKEISSELENFRLNKKLNDRKVFLIDNIRFFPEEKSNDIDFAAKILKDLKIEIYVNDAFPVCHREHASVSAVPYLSKYKYAGFALLEELKMLESTLGNAFNSHLDITAIIGGKKIATKTILLQSLIKKVTNIVIIGGMANTFFKTLEIDIGDSFYESEMLDKASEIIKSFNVFLPLDVVVKTKNGDVKTITLDDKIDGCICDIGPRTNQLIDEIISGSDVVVWNGPAGVCEDERFSTGTINIAKSLASKKCKSIIGGGDTSTIINKMDLKSQMDYVSNGGGAFIAWLENEILHGIEKLQS